MSAILTADKLTRRFGGLTAINSVTWSLKKGEIHAVIGPNGAGKTTFLNLLSGVARPDGGTIEIDGTRLDGQSAHVFARHGVGRSFQRTNIFDGMTVAENVKTAALVHLGHAFRFVRPFAGYKSLEEEAERALSLVGLLDRRHRLAQPSEMRFCGLRGRETLTARRRRRLSRRIWLARPMAARRAATRTACNRTFSLESLPRASPHITGHHVRTV